MIKHFIDIEDFSKIKLDKILLMARKLKKNKIKYNNIFKNKSLGLLFQKESTRTLLSFTIGFQKLGGHVINLNDKEIGFGKRESEEDILKVLSQYLDCLMVRNNSHNKIKHYASLNVIPIINGLSDYSHPCQILSDILTMQEFLGNLSKKTICWIGDFNNVLIPLIQIQKLYAFKLNIVMPKKIIESNINYLNKIKNSRITFTHDIKNGVLNSNCLMTDVWVSMGENNFNKKNLFKKYQVNEKLMNLANRNAIFMHCLPAKRGQEVTNEVIDGSQSVVWQQAENRMYVQQAILNYILK